MFWQRFTELCFSINKFPNNVAADLDLSSATITGWKQGAVPRMSTLRKIADYFGVSVEYLKGETNMKSPTDDDASRAEKEVVQLFNGIPDEKKTEAMNYLRYLAGQKEEK